MAQLHTRHPNISIQIRNHTSEPRSVRYFISMLDGAVFGLDEDGEPDDVVLVSDVWVVPVEEVSRCVEGAVGEVVEVDDCGWGGCGVGCVEVGVEVDVTLMFEDSLSAFHRESLVPTTYP
jgi:hypothetical protein